MSAWAKQSAHFRPPLREASTLAPCSNGTRFRLNLAGRFARSYRSYCWPVESLRDIRIAPFQVMATDGVHADKDHVWHMDTISSFVQDADGPLIRTPYQVVDLADPVSEAAATACGGT